MLSIRRHNFKLAYQSFRVSKARSFLTMLGIIIGVMAAILVVCIGQGIKEQISGKLSHYGKNVFMVQPASATSSASFIGGLSSASSGLISENDLHRVQKTEGVSEAVPLATVTGSVTGDHTIGTPFVVATTADYANVANRAFKSGGFFEPGDDQSVVLGLRLAEELFDSSVPIGQSVTWRGERFIVSGVYDELNAPPFSLEADFDNAMFVPYDTAQKLSGGVLGSYQILAKADTAADTDAVVSRVSAALTSSHGGAHDDAVFKASSGNQASEQTVHLLTVLVTGAAIIALIVGGVGIMNIMLVSVTERMHEIGIRKAIGATNQQIMRQFVAEAFVLSTMGAVIGLLLSCVSVGLLRLYTSLQAVLVWQILIIAPLVAITVGLFFGSVPALKAARKDPIEALRHE